MPEEQLDIFGGAVPYEASLPPELPPPTPPNTSQVAGQHAEVRYMHHRYETLQLYSGYGETDDDAVRLSQRFSPDGQTWHPGTTAKRRFRLQQAGLIEPCVGLTGRIETRATRTGEQATIWRLTAAGRQLLALWREMESADDR